MTHYSDFEVEMEDEDDDYEDDEEDDNDRFFKSILNGDIDHVQAMKGAGYNALTINKYGNMALHFATLNSKVDILRLFEEQLRCKPEINTVHIQDVDICGTALHIAMDGQVSVETVSFLLEWGANANATDYREGTVLHELLDMAWSDFEKHFDCEKYLKSNPQGGDSYLAKLSLLKDYGVDMNKRHGLTGLTPLHKWCQQFVWCTEARRDEEDGRIPEWCSTFLDLMLKFGADPKLADERGESPLFYLAQRHYKPDDRCYREGYSRLCRKLVSVSDLTQIDNNGRTILHASAEFSNCELMEQLLHRSVDVNSKDKIRLTAMHLITHNITKDEQEGFVLHMLCLLKCCGADLDVQDRHGSTPLHHAVHMKNVTAIKYLLQEEADVSIKDNAGMDVVELASIDGNQEIKNLLGNIYQRTQTPIIPGISDVRVGYFHPTCCHQRTEDIALSENPEIVNETDIQEFLEHFNPCYHNRLFMIQNAIRSHETNRRQCDLSLKDSCQIADEVIGIMEMAATHIGNETELFQCDVILGGSNSEGTKIGAFDEFDFVFLLKRVNDFIIPEEHADNVGFVKLKVKDNADIGIFPKSSIDADGYIKKSVVSNEFHKLLEKVLRNKDMFENNSFLSYAGTVNAEGECWDIGQLNLLWHGPFKKRQKVKIDVVPAISIPHWQSGHLNSDLKLLQQTTLRSAGCYFVMKNARSQVAKLENMDADNDGDVIKMEDNLFRISFSQLEHALIGSLPEEARQGIKLAKSILMQVPKLASQRMVFNSAGICREVLRTSDDHLLFVTSVFDFITSYKIKLGLLHRLNEETFQVKIDEKNFEASSWNRLVMKKMRKIERRDCLNGAIEWSRKIYRSMVRLAENKGCIPDFFVPLHENESESETQGSDFLTKYCAIALHFLERFEIPTELQMLADTS